MNWCRMRCRIAAKQLKPGMCIKVDGVTFMIPKDTPKDKVALKSKIGSEKPTYAVSAHY
jgi:hypothetical protein